MIKILIFCLFLQLNQSDQQLGQSDQYLLCNKRSAIGHLVVNEAIKHLWIKFYVDNKWEQFSIMYTVKSHTGTIVYHVINDHARGNVFILSTEIEIDLTIDGKAHYNEGFLRCKLK